MMLYYNTAKKNLLLGKLTVDMFCEKDCSILSENEIISDQEKFDKLFIEKTTSETKKCIPTYE